MVKSRAADKRRAKVPQAAARRDDTQRIAEMIGLAAGAKTIADNLGEKFLSYLLAMVIQEMSSIDSRRAQLSEARRSKPAPPTPSPD